MRCQKLTDIILQSRIRLYVRPKCICRIRAKILTAFHTCTQLLPAHIQPMLDLHHLPAVDQRIRLVWPHKRIGHTNIRKLPDQACSRSCLTVARYRIPLRIPLHLIIQIPLEHKLLPGIHTIFFIDIIQCVCIIDVFRFDLVEQ